MKTTSLYLLLFVFLSATLQWSCVKEDHFGASGEHKILSFSLEQQVGNSIINQDSLTIHITVSAQADLTALRPAEATLSTFATLSPSKEDYRDFTDDVIYLVTAEDGSTASYTVVVFQEGSEPQLENSSFDAWYTTPKGYQEPGTDANTIWASGNAGVTTLGSANVTPMTISGSDIAATLVTRDMGNLAGLIGQRMAAGSMFTGDFVLDIANPLNSAKFGSSFTARPSSFSVDYAYSPGTPYLNKNGAVQNKLDSCDIYLLLEHRTDTEIKRVATGWFRSGAVSIDSFTTLEIPLVYGPLGTGVPSYQKPTNGLYADASEPVTHISVVFSSSHNGALLEGGTNSTLVVNNLKLHYD